MKSPRTWWFVFGGGALVIAAGLGWITLVVLQLEAEARWHESMRLALWRMDSWLSPRLAREASRPYFEYLPYSPQERAYTKMLNVIETGDVLIPSPLLTFRSEFFPIHFQVSAEGVLTSPQVPTSNQRDLAEATLLAGEMIDQAAALLETVRPLVQHESIAAQIRRNEELILVMTCEAAQAPAPANDFALNAPQQAQSLWTQNEQQKRQINYNDAQQEGALRKQAEIDAGPAKDGAISPSPLEVTVGPLVPLWIESSRVAAGSESTAVFASNDNAVEGDRALLFVRRVSIGSTEFLQGFLVDWPRLRAALLEQVADLFPSAHLTGVNESLETSRSLGRNLATIPAALDSAPAAIAVQPLFTTARGILGLVWLAMLAAVAAAGNTLRSTIAYAEKRSRFASAVTHELRTPLTTFRMYSEMLAEGMVRDDDQRRTYLETLRSESGRLTTLVENVLAYARLEEGRVIRHPQRTSIQALLQRVRDPLTHRAHDAGMDLAVDVPPPAGDRALTTDVDVVGQILFNLVDNACKYAHGAADRRIQLQAHIQGDDLQVRVRDHGPGVRPEHARIIFAPFERGQHNPGDTIPGVGLGLALSRGLARDLGGDLRLDDQEIGGGACFVLSLPMARASV